MVLSVPLLRALATANKSMVGKSPTLTGFAPEPSKVGRAVSQEWEAVKQFALNANPNGAWSYGSATAAGGTFTLLPMKANPCLATGLVCWENSAGFPSYAAVVRNTTGAPVNYATIVAPANLLWLAIQANEVVVRWTAPATGEYLAAGTFSGIDTGQAPVSVMVYVNGAVSAQSTISSYGQSYSFKTGALALKAGATIDFAGAFTTNDSYDNVGLTTNVYQLMN